MCRIMLDLPLKMTKLQFTQRYYWVYMELILASKPKDAQPCTYKRTVTTVGANGKFSLVSDITVAQIKKLFLVSDTEAEELCNKNQINKGETLVASFLFARRYTSFPRQGVYI